MNLQSLFQEPIKEVQKINEGFSLDDKYIVNHKYVVRVISLDRYERFEEVFQVQRKFYQVALCQKPYRLTRDPSFGYYITEYIEGQNGLDVITTYPNKRQYELGTIAAKELVKFHQAYPIPEFDMKQHLDDFLEVKINACKDNNVIDLLPEINDIIALVKSKIHHLYHLNGVQTHSDYHLFNMIFADGNYKGVIDFERVSKGCFLRDFRNNTPHNSPVSPYFASGYIDGYLDEIPIKDFFLMYNIYDLLLTIATIPWVLQYDKDHIESTIDSIRLIYAQKDNLSSSPKWYLGRYDNT